MSYIPESKNGYQAAATQSANTVSHLVLDLTPVDLNSRGSLLTGSLRSWRYAGASTVGVWKDHGRREPAYLIWPPLTLTSVDLYVIYSRSCVAMLQRLSSARTNRSLLSQSYIIDVAILLIQDAQTLPKTLQNVSLLENVRGNLVSFYIFYGTNNAKTPNLFILCYISLEE